jgi:hypothetical protein
VTLRVIGIAVTTVLVLSVAWTVASSFARATSDSAFSVDGVRSVRVDVDAAEVVVERTAGDAVEVQVTSTGTWQEPVTTREQDGTTLRLTSRCGPSFGFDRCEVSYRVEVPDGVDVDLRASAGRLAVDGIDGDVVARADAGEIELTDLRSASVDARTQVGRVAAGFTEAPDEVRATTQTGAVEITLPRSGEPYDVDASSAVGGSLVEVVTDPASPRSVTATTSVGQVTVTSR